MQFTDQIKEILVELLDVAPDAIAMDSYLVRDLGVESIDFLELAVLLNERFEIPVEDDTLFLRNLRLHLTTAQDTGAAPLDCLGTHYPFLNEDRLREILTDLEGGPVIQVRDLLSYVQWQTTQPKAA